MWSTDHKTSGRIDEEFCILIYHICRKDFIKNVFFHVFMDLFLWNIRIMLCRKYYCIKAGRNSIFIIFYCYLCFSIRTKIWKCSVLSYFCKTSCKFVCKSDRIRHIFFCLIRCISEHHSLVSCTDCFQFFIWHLVFLCFKSFINTHSNIAWLFVNCCQNTTCVSIKSVLSSCITNFANSITNDFLNIYICICSNFSHYHNNSCSRACLASYTAHWILFHKCIQDRIGNLVAHLIRMSFSYWFRSK